MIISYVKGLEVRAPDITTHVSLYIVYIYPMYTIYVTLLLYDSIDMFRTFKLKKHKF